VDFSATLPTPRRRVRASFFSYSSITSSSLIVRDDVSPRRSPTASRPFPSRSSFSALALLILSSVSWRLARLVLPVSSRMRPWSSTTVSSKPSSYDSRSVRERKRVCGRDETKRNACQWAAERSVREASRGCDALPLPTSSTAIYRDSVISQRGAYLSSPPRGCWRPRRWVLGRRHHLPLGPKSPSDPGMTRAASRCGRRAMRTAIPIAFDELFLGGYKKPTIGSARFAPGFTFPVSA
jgi:hypothetical protein